MFLVNLLVHVMAAFLLLFNSHACIYIEVAQILWERSLKWICKNTNKRNDIIFHFYFYFSFLVLIRVRGISYWFNFRLKSALGIRE